MVSLRKVDGTSSQLVTTTMLALLFCGVVGVQNRRLSQALGEGPGTLSGPADLVRGDIVPGFRATGVPDRSMEVSFGAFANWRVLLIFSPSCGPCRQQISTWWRQLIKEAPESVELLGVSLEGTDATTEWLDANGLDFATAIMPNLAIQRAYRVNSIPLLLVVSPEGSVEWVKYGLLDPDSFSEVLALLAGAPVSPDTVRRFTEE